MLYGSCSTKRAPRILKNKWVLHILVGWIVANQNKSARIRTLSILKILYTGCSTKDAIKLLLLRNTKVSRENHFYTFTLGKWWQIKRNATRIRILLVLKLLYSGYFTMEQYHSSFCGAPKISRPNDFYGSILGE